MFNLTLKSIPNLLKKFNSSANISMISLKSPILCTKTPWSAQIVTQILCGRQGLVAFAKGMPCRVTFKSSTTILWTLHHHQGYGWQWFWTKYPHFPWLPPNVQCGPPFAIVSTIVGHIKNRRATNTNRAQPKLHWTCHNCSNCGHTN